MPYEYEDQRAYQITPENTLYHVPTGALFAPTHHFAYDRNQPNLYWGSSMFLYDENEGQTTVFSSRSVETAKRQFKRYIVLSSSSAGRRIWDWFSSAEEAKLASLNGHEEIDATDHAILARDVFLFQVGKGKFVAKHAFGRRVRGIEVGVGFESGRYPDSATAYNVGDALGRTTLRADSKPLDVGLHLLHRGNRIDIDPGEYDEQQGWIIIPHLVAMEPRILNACPVTEAVWVKVSNSEPHELSARYEAEVRVVPKFEWATVMEAAGRAKDNLHQLEAPLFEKFFGRTKQF